RTAFPDVMWRMNGAARGIEMPDALRPPIARLNAAAMNDVLAHAGRLLIAMRAGSRTEEQLRQAVGWDPDRTGWLLGTLEALRYISKAGGGYALAVPVLSADDAEMVRGVRAESGRIMQAWLASDYAPLRDDLKDLSPVREGVPYEQVFTRI